MTHLTRKVSPMSPLRGSIPIILVLAILAPSALARSAQAGRAPLFQSARLLLLRKNLLPHRYRYHGYFIQDNVATWDGGIRPIMQIDEQHGWIEGAEESIKDPKKHDALLSIQLFRTPAGARADFGQFFTNSHPETVYEPGSDWLGGSPVGGYGHPATIYRIHDGSSRCPKQLVSGLTFVYRNGIFSVGACLETVGESGVRDLARRLLRRAHVAPSR